MNLYLVDRQFGESDTIETGAERGEIDNALLSKFCKAGDRVLDICSGTSPAEKTC